MSLLQEIHARNASILANITTNTETEALALSFCEQTGLDLSDYLYREENLNQLREYAETGKIPQDPRGFDYTDLIEKGCFPLNSRRWIKAHYNGKKTLLELEILGYKSYCKAAGILPQNFANLNVFFRNAKEAQRG